MKDAYSFDRDEEGLGAQLRAQPRGVPPDLRALRPRDVRRAGRERDHGRQRVSVDFLAPAGSGENTLVTCENGDYAADVEVARGDSARAPSFPPRTRRARGDRDARGDDDRGAGGVPRARRGRDVEGDAGREGRRHARARARPRRRPARASRSCCDAPRERLASGDRRRDPRRVRRRAAARSARSAVEGEVVADEALREGQFVAGANRDGWHLRGVEAGRDYEPRFADIREPREGDRVPSAAARSSSGRRSRSATSSTSARATRSRSARRSSTRTGRSGRSSAAATGSAPARVMAAVVEQHHDENGIVWPESVAPYEVHVVALPGRRGARGARRPRRSRRGARSVLLDDRDQRRGRSSPTPT